jgi:hypothetical protein
MKDVIGKRINAVPGTFKRINETQLHDFISDYKVNRMGVGPSRGCSLMCLVTSESKDNKDRWVFTSSNRANILMTEHNGFWDSLKPPRHLTAGDDVFILPDAKVRDLCKKEQKELFAWRFTVSSLENITEDNEITWWGGGRFGKCFTKKKLNELKQTLEQKIEMMFNF